ncbi:uncharacterized protein LOC129938620 [Eupeodes corollae]|uniref:uncharacterized protein LOC129938620 n=1 Tax=Eupeodes corollae TaxID=290404 RepID=UPI002492A14C|nr:uncharacterized protein LOC129938620 [Eupeodes corollae]
MRSFFILGLLAASASAGVLSGYNYGPGVSGIREEILPAAASSSGHKSGHYNSGSYSNGGIISSGSSNFNNGHYQQYSIGIDDLDYVPQTVQYSKQFYHFDAPAEAQLEGRITKQLSNSLKKNLQVVFIKAPENNVATNAALQLAKQAIEQKTAIYVLSKQHDEAQLVGQLQQIQENVQTAPEVRFVKYRTPEDVQRAKQSIQAQYDNVGGVSEIYNGGYAPVLNYASAGKPFQFVFGEPNNKASGKYYKTVYNKSGPLNLSSAQSSGTESLASGSGISTSGSGSANFALGASGSGSFTSGSKSTKLASGSSFSSPQSIGTSSIISESAPTNIKSESSFSSLSFGSSSNLGSASGAAQLNEAASSAGSSNISGTGSFISSESYLPPLKK